VTMVEHFLAFTRAQLREERERSERQFMGRTLRKLASRRGPWEWPDGERFVVNPEVIEIVRSLPADATDEEIFNAVRMWGPQ
jgi:hypothetical protein